MTQLLTVSRELFRRQSDNRFADLPSLLTAARDRRDRSSEKNSIPASALLFREASGLPGDISVSVDHDRYQSPPLALTNYSLGQLATAARAPIELLERLLPATRARVLNESVRKAELSDRSLLLESNGDGTAVLRALTSDRYARVWDADVFGRVHDWLSPYGYRPATPTFRSQNGADIFGDHRPALWSGDRDSFGFFYTEPDGGGGADFGGLRRGVYIGNSEVGAAALHFATFMFRDLCANFIVWGAESVKRRKARHVGQTNRVFTVYAREIQRLAREVEPLPLQLLDKAARTAFAGDGSPTDANIDSTVDRLRRQFGLGAAESADVVTAAMLPQNARRTSAEPELSFWTIANGVTWNAKATAFASDLLAGAQVAERILAGVA